MITDVMDDGKTFYAFTETDIFMRRIEKLASTETLFSIQRELLQNPRKGTVIKGTNGARKARVAGRGKGKSGGFPYVYLYLELNERIYLLFLFGKDEQDNLTDKQKKELSEVIRRIKESHDE